MLITYISVGLQDRVYVSAHNLKMCTQGVCFVRRFYGAGISNLFQLFADSDGVVSGISAFMGILYFHLA